MTQKWEFRFLTRKSEFTSKIRIFIFGLENQNFGFWLENQNFDFWLENQNFDFGLGNPNFDFWLEAQNFIFWVVPENVWILNFCGKRFEINIKKEKQFYSHFIMVEYRMTLVVKSWLHLHYFYFQETRICEKVSLEIIFKVHGQKNWWPVIDIEQILALDSPIYWPRDIKRKVWILETNR